MLINPILVGLQFTFFINNLDPGVNNVKAIKNALEDGSEPIFDLKPNKFF